MEKVGSCWFAVILPDSVLSYKVLSQDRASAPLQWTVPFTIREFQPSDFDTLWHIDQECFPPGISYSRAELKAYIRRRGSFTLLAVGDGPKTGSSGPAEQRDVSPTPVNPAAGGDSSVAGFIVAEAGRDRAGHVITIDVVSPARRSGIGSLLLQATENRLRDAACRSIELETAVDNVSALSFYKRHGYAVIRTFPRYYSNGVDALVLEKDLTGNQQRRQIRFAL
ncbi:MAG TPA: N-acetyltransferase [Candidatus Acidoferrum sp.]|nr:N-acetyltransferase [Candidatus Acidoferrum sp.]